MTFSADIGVFFSTRFIRLFCYGFLAVILALYLVDVGLGERHVGLLFSLALAGDAAILLWLTTSADEVGRKRILMIGALLMLASGLVFATSANFAILLIAAIVGVISPNGREIGPFLSVEQAAVSQLVRDEERTRVFAWYNVVGSIAAALGALGGGWLVHLMEARSVPAAEAYRAMLYGYALGGAVLLMLFAALSSRVEAPSGTGPVEARRVLGLHRSRGVVLRLSALSGLDSLGGGLIVQSMIAYWFHVRFGLDAGAIGSIFFSVNLLAAISALGAPWLTRRFGLLNTMIFTHLPSNVILMLVPCMPTLELAVAMLLLRFSTSQMDVPTRQSYTMAVVSPMNDRQLLVQRPLRGRRGQLFRRRRPASFCPCRV